MAIETKSNVSVDVLNRIRESASVNYQAIVPVATAGAEVIKEIGKIIVDSPNIQNEFLNCLINRIGKTIITARLFENPLKMFNKGELEFGSVIEEVFTDLCKPYQFSEREAEQNIYKRVIPDVRTAFHVVNSELFYKQTISEARIRRAFTSLDGVEQLIRDITTVMYTSANYDEYLMVKYLIAKSALDGTVTIVPVTAITDKASADAALTSFKEYSNNFEFLSTEYNIMGVHSASPKSAQYLITDTHNDAFIGVNSLAYMFGPAFADDDTKKVRVDSFAKFDIERLKELLGIESEPFTSDELNALNNIEAVLVDENFFQIWYQLIQTLNKYNEEGLSYNVWLHCWKVFSRSPFSNVAIFASGTNGVDSITIDSAPTVTHGVAGKGSVKATVVVSGLSPKMAAVVDWSVSTTDTAGKVEIDSEGNLTWDDAFTASKKITVTATSHVDSTKTASTTITVA